MRMASIAVFCISTTLISCGLMAAAEPPKPRAHNTIFILDRGRLGNVPHGALEAAVCRNEACTASLFSAFQMFEQNKQDREMKNCDSILVSLQVLQNLDILLYRFEKSPQERERYISQLLSLIPDQIKIGFGLMPAISDAKKWGSDGNSLLRERLQAEGCLRSTELKQKRIKDFYYIFRTKNSNLQLVVLFPKNRCNDPLLALHNHGFSCQEFEQVGYDAIVQDYGAGYPENIAQPLDIEAFRKLFHNEAARERNFFLLGHGNDGLIAQLKRDSFAQFVNVLHMINCSSLAIFSCHASAIQNDDVYKSLFFPIIVFSIGDTVSIFSHTQTKFKQYFDCLNKYLRLSALQEERQSLDQLSGAAAAIHADLPQNFAWFYFPGREPIHLSRLCEESNAQSNSAIPENAGYITPEMVNNSDTAQLTFLDKQSLLLHAAYIAKPIFCCGSVPRMFPLVKEAALSGQGTQEAPLYVFEQINLGNMYLDEFIGAVKLFPKLLFIKNLLCLNYKNSHIANNIPGEPLECEHVIVAAGPGTNDWPIIFKLKGGFLNYFEVTDTAVKRIDYMQAVIKQRYDYWLKAMHDIMRKYLPDCHRILCPQVFANQCSRLLVSTQLVSGEGLSLKRVAENAINDPRGSKRRKIENQEVIHDA